MKQRMLRKEQKVIDIATYSRFPRSRDKAPGALVWAESGRKGA